MNLLNQLLSEMSIVLKGIISAVRSFHIDNGFADPLSKAEVLFFFIFSKNCCHGNSWDKIVCQ